MIAITFAVLPHSQLKLLGEYEMKNSINYDRINQTLKRYSKLYEIFGKITGHITLESFPYKQDKTITEYNFYAILNLQDFPDELAEEYKIRLENSEGIFEKISISSYLCEIIFKKQTLEKLDRLCKKLENIYNNEQLKNGIKNNIFSFLSELEFANFFQMKGFEILEIDPLLKSGNRLDLKIKWRNKPMLVEVITPREKLYMKNKSDWLPMSLECEKNINYEFEEHKIEANDIKEPFIIAVDGDLAGIDDINIQSTIEEFTREYENKSKFLSGIFLKRGINTYIMI